MSTVSRGRTASRRLRVLVTHPGASLYGSDRMLLEAVRGMVDAGWSPLLCARRRGR